MAGEGEYKPLNLWRADRVNVLKEFMSPIKKHINTGLGVGVRDAKRFGEITQGIKKHIRPEVFCFKQVIKLVAQRMEEWEKEFGWTEPEPYQLFFDDVEDYTMKIYRVLCMLKKADPFARKKSPVLRLASAKCGLPSKLPICSVAPWRANTNSVSGAMLGLSTTAFSAAPRGRRSRLR